MHGNGGSIGDLRAQIAHFRRRYKVIAMDSRDQGKSGDSPDTITYEKMTDDLAALLDHLKVGPVNVLGWSDGGIEALLLGIRHPAKVKKIAAMAANLNPSEDAVYPESSAMVKSMMAAIPAAAQDTPAGPARAQGDGDDARGAEHRAEGARGHHRADAGAGRAITTSIRDEHTLDIYHHIPNSQLAIFPERDAHGSVRRSGDVQRHRRAVLPHAVREEGADQGHDGVAGEDEGVVAIGGPRRDEWGSRFGPRRSLMRSLWPA